MTTLNLEVIEEGGGETVILVHGGDSSTKNQRPDSNMATLMPLR